jgi:ABC-type dipeptide/oligopeptide/nickel transport system permease component
LFLVKAAGGDLGESFRYRTAALPLVLGRLPTTLLLAGASVVLSTLISLPLGVLAATRKGRLPDTLASLLALLAISMPSFWLGVILILVFAGALRVLPASGSGTWQQLILPTITISAFSIGLLTRLIRRSVAETLTQPFVTTARSKGLSERSIAWVHVLRNSAIPVVTVMGLQFGALVGGSVVVETVFAWPGVGWLMIQSIEARDLPVIRAAVLVLAVFIVAINLCVDVLYTVIDPRIRLEGRAWS